MDMPLCYIQYFREIFPIDLTSQDHTVSLNYFYHLLLAGKFNLWEVNILTGEVVDFGYSESLATKIGYEPRETSDLHQETVSRREYFFERLHPDDRKMVEEKLRRVYTDGEEYEAEYRIRFNNPDRYEWILARGNCYVNSKGLKTKVVGTWRNITHEKTQNLLVHNQQRALERMSRVYSMAELATTIAHDLSQPLLAAHLHIAEVERQLKSQAPDQTALGVLRQAQKQIDEATTIIHKVKGLITENEFKKESIFLPDLIKQVAKICNHLNLSPLNLKMSSEGDVSLIDVDPTQMSQVFFILFNNSIEAVPNIEQLSITIQLKQQEERLIIMYHDNGIGIPPENINSIFTPFFSSKENSMGIGLFICRRILQAFGGSINLVADENKGAHFCIELPTSKG